MKRLALFLGTLLVLNAVAPAVQAQEIVDEALQVFTTRTERLEYLHSAELRGLSNYSVLRQRYLGGDLRDLEKSLAALGIDEGDVDELVLGWDAAIAGKDSGTGGSMVLLAVIFAGKRLPNGLWSSGWNRPRLVMRKPTAQALSKAPPVSSCLMTRAVLSVV
ncbi:MAG TPA: hypothetical protein VKF63_00875 [Terracidiphilus sp.]|nr:hypothetical protein [Terracidiphilus sp.]